MNHAPVEPDEAHVAVEEWLSYPGIVMLDTGAKVRGGHELPQRAIIVGVVKKRPGTALTPLDFPVPPSVEVEIRQPDGTVATRTIPTDVVETGEIRPMSLSWQERPCPGGFRIEAQPRKLLLGMVYVQSKGTLGVTTDFRNQQCLLTNCHVIGDRAMAPGNALYQPAWSTWRQRREDNAIGVCDGTVSILTYGTPTVEKPVLNQYDFAWSVMNDANLMSHRIQDIYDGQAALPIRRDPLRGNAVTWIGATTGMTQQSTIASANVMAKWPRGDMWAFWKRLIRITVDPGAPVVMQHGDSGAALLRRRVDAHGVETFSVVGLLSAASDDGTHIFATRIPDENLADEPQKMRIRPPGP
ncbi:hypothetical protein [Streptomyces sp. BE147]|uniref:hypothetical protein n=1 Tax=unclassified Streptomyces TaxID=2593676 RepID=UPI002E7832EE|nr:hypothetical protein [Streptomyces sp. BE147]MEE1742036.1 hypothetical protein [Streptomyces sp. BE147]